MDSGFYVICGLGNPGSRYEGTRHNIGFAVIDELVDAYHIDNPVRFGKCLMAKGRIGAARVILMKPLTYMNLSGEAVREVVDYYKVDVTDHLLVISDDIDLAQGQLRIRKKGSAGGHNGLKNIVQHLGTQEFSRIRVGVGAKPNPDYDLADYVLGHFQGDDKKTMEAAAARAAEAAAFWVENGTDLTMNRFNTPKEKKKKAKRQRVQQADAAVGAQESPAEGQPGTGQKSPAGAQES